MHNTPRKIILTTVVIVLITAVSTVLYTQKARTTQDEIAFDQKPSAGNQSNIENPSLQTYENSDAGYSIQYPSDWQLPTIKESAQGDFNFIIKNILDAYTVGDKEASLNAGASIVHISVSNFLNGVSFAEYETMDDFIQDPRFVSPSGVTSKLAYVRTMDIGGKTLRVMHVRSETSDSYRFIHNGKHYTISFTSGSAAQYTIDTETFKKILSSFILL